MHIVSLASQNVKRLKAVTITPDGNLVVVKGNNGQGKSSVLDSIAYALGGKDTHPPEVIRSGEERAQVVLDLGDLVVERKWTANDKSSVSVRSKEGAKFSSPQAMLDGLVGRLSFDPLAFMRLRPKDQAETLRELLGLDFTALDADRAETFAARTAVNREVAQLEAALKRMPEVEAPDELESVEDLLAELRERQSQESVQTATRAALSEVQSAWNLDAKELQARKERVADLEAQLSAAKEKVAEKEAELAKLTKEGKTLRAQVDAMQPVDLETVQARLRNVESTNERVRQRQARQAEQSKLKERQAEAQALTEHIAKLDADKAAALAKAPFPVPGLGIGEEGLTLNGLPIAQASSAEQLRVSLAMGLALNPKLKVVLIRDGSLLDAQSLAMVSEMAAEAGAQVWVEVVGKGGEVGVVIEDGEVSE